MRTAPICRWNRLCRSLVCLLAAVTVGCAWNPDEEPRVLRLATTTSTRDSGLLDQLIPRFEKEYDCRVDVIAVGSGAALKLGERGDADVLLVHAPRAEHEFIKRNYGKSRTIVMSNEYLIVGPPGDPARIKGLQPYEAIRQIASREGRFASRGDQSGTHLREQAIWKQLGIEPDWTGYLETGSGMGATLVVAHEMQLYTLTDRGTYLRFQDKIDLVPLVEDPQLLKNDYSVIVVNPDLHPGINYGLATAFREFMTSEQSRDVIDRFRIGNQQLFHSIK